MNFRTHAAQATENMIGDLGITRADLDAVTDGIVPDVAALRAGLADLQDSIRQCEQIGDASDVLAQLRETEQTTLKAIAICKLAYLVDIRGAELAPET
jgi:hypothetical protein